jgi:GLPGLI family protein
MKKCSKLFFERFLKINFMKKIILILLIFSLSSSKGQNEKQDLSYVTYKFKSTGGESNKSKRFDPTLLDFEFLFDKQRSLFRIIIKMDLNQSQDYKITSIIYGGNLVYFRDNVAKERLFNVNYKGQSLNVINSKQEYKWDLLSESKYIGGFKCFKAVTKIIKNDQGRNTVKTLNPIVWFTPDIPTSFGPFGLDGLPGLIIEGTMDGLAFFYADKFILNSNKNIQIDRPEKSIDIFETAFDSMISEDFINSRIKK